MGNSEQHLWEKTGAFGDFNRGAGRGRIFELLLFQPVARYRYGGQRVRHVQEHGRRTVRGRLRPVLRAWGQGRLFLSGSQKPGGRPGSVAGSYQRNDE